MSVLAFEDRLRQLISLQGWPTDPLCWTEPIASMEWRLRRQIARALARQHPATSGVFANCSFVFVRDLKSHEHRTRTPTTDYSDIRPDRICDCQSRGRLDATLSASDGARILAKQRAPTKTN